MKSTELRHKRTGGIDRSTSNILASFPVINAGDHQKTREETGKKLITEILTYLQVLSPLYFLFTPKVKRYHTIPFYYLNGFGPIFKVSAIPLPPHSPPYAEWNYSPPSFLALASSSNPTTQQICSILRYGPLCIWENKKNAIAIQTTENLQC